MPLFNQLLADVLDRELVTVSCKETTGIGAYISMLLGCGEIEEKDISDILIQEKTAVYTPEIEDVYKRQIQYFIGYFIQFFPYNPSFFNLFHFYDNFYRLLFI